MKGQLGIPVTHSHDNVTNTAVDTTENNANYKSNITIIKPKFNNTRNYKILDIAAGEFFSLVLVQLKDANSINRTYLYKFSLFDKEQLEHQDRAIETIHLEDFDYEKEKITQVYTNGHRILLLTESNSIYIKGMGFTITEIQKYRLLVERFPKKILYLTMGNCHCMLFTGIP